MISQILCYPPCITRYSGIFIVKKGVTTMSSESTSKPHVNIVKKTVCRASSDAVHGQI